MTTKLATPQYIYPPRPHTCIPRTELNEFGKMGWIAQLKYNGARSLIKYLPNGEIELWGRHAERFKKYHPPTWLQDQLKEIAIRLNIKQGDWSLLDSELLDFKHEAIRDTIAIFDILVLNNEYLVGTKYINRYEQLRQIAQNTPWYYTPPHHKHEPIAFGYQITDHTLLPMNFPHGTWDDLWKLTETVNAPYTATGKGPVIEGLVGKDPNGELSRAYKEQNNGEWMTRSRVTTGRHRF